MGFYHNLVRWVAFHVKERSCIFNMTNILCHAFKFYVTLRVLVGDLVALKAITLSSNKAPKTIWFRLTQFELFGNWTVLVYLKTASIHWFRSILTDFTLIPTYYLMDQLKAIKVKPFHLSLRIVYKKIENCYIHIQINYTKKLYKSKFTNWSSFIWSVRSTLQY